MTHRVTRLPRWVLLLALVLAGMGLARAPLVLTGQLTFFNDSGAFLLDLGNMGAGKSLAGKLIGVEVRSGAGDFVKKNIPVGALVSFTVIRKGAYPEGTITYAGHDLGQWLVSKKLAKALAKGL
jgi:hypothetical protein